MDRVVIIYRLTTRMLIGKVPKESIPNRFKDYESIIGDAIKVRLINNEHTVLSAILKEKLLHPVRTHK